MSLPIASVLENLSSRNSPTNNLITIGIIGGLILVVLLTLLTIALPALEEAFEQDNFPSLELGSIAWYAAHVLSDTLPLALGLQALFGLMKPEHVSAHIGEKRPSDGQMLTLDKLSFNRDLFWTALFSSVVLFVLSVWPLVRGNNSYLVFVRDRSTRSCSKKARPHFIHGGSQLCGVLSN